MKKPEDDFVTKKNEKGSTVIYRWKKRTNKIRLNFLYTLCCLKGTKSV